MLTPIKLYRITKGIKAVEIAKKANISVSMFSKIENGVSPGSKKTRESLAKAVGVSEKNLFGKTK